ncbi:MAG: TOBE domain-containing protein [Pseudomonadales bacterium]|nr:TOBE domain-containing protein [Pseudomonadales bacterium]
MNTESTRMELLAEIDSCGSLLRAAKRLRISYEVAWNAVHAMNNVSAHPLVICSVQDSVRGASMQLSPLGRQLLYVWRCSQKAYQRYLSQATLGIDNIEQIHHLLRTINMKSSARNQLRGTLTSINRGPVNGEVKLDLGHGMNLSATITNEAIEDLQLQVGKDALAIIKASFIVLSPDANVRMSARNRLTGTIIKLIPGTINSELKLELPGGKILTAVVTCESIQEFSFAPGQPCTALIKASHIIIAVD